MASAVIIGGGPAGSIAAIFLRRSGFSVDLLEQNSFPRDKVCGECLSGLGVDVLERAGVARSLREIEPARLTRTLLHAADGSCIEVPLPRASMGVTRLKMDVLLLTSAMDAGVQVHQPARCEAIEPGESPLVRWRALRTNQRHEVRADWVLLADGKGALLPGTAKATGDLGLKTHFELVDAPTDAIELFAGDGHYGGIAAVEDNRWNAAFSVPARLVKQHAGDLQAVFDHVVNCNVALHRRVAGGRRCGPWLASPLPRFAVARRWPDRVMPIGNAAAALEPVGGEGMGLALRSAELAAGAIVAAEAAGDLEPVARLPGEFRKLWQVRRTVCRGIAMMFSRADFADAVAPLIWANVQIPEAMMRWAGKAETASAADT
jgi:flavin-dependent dehydrogenase